MKRRVVSCPQNLEVAPTHGNRGHCGDDVASCDVGCVGVLDSVCTPPCPLVLLPFKSANRNLVLPSMRSGMGVYITLAPMEGGLCHRPASPIGSQTHPCRSSHVFPSTADNRREELASTVRWKVVEWFVSLSPQSEGWCELCKKLFFASCPDPSIHFDEQEQNTSSADQA
ncbi:hypothetical protein BLNAU_23577 [Blattamonas nauphoetae]|uniref:Uncharacterized protein n=1 Tax=Blattamonas nauphoetae TaxID=2049346 RepID=A0ABQ9WPU5_9EUKA|nr:hypothetical protein BLNAU_23577 [Blattamonas nauphoetae]